MYKTLATIPIFLALFSCTKEELSPTPCYGDCETSYEVIYQGDKYFIVPQSSILMIERDEELFN